MRKVLALVLSLPLLACACSSARTVDEVIAAHPQQTIAVSYYDLGTRETFERNERVVLHAASTMKVPVMLAIFDAVSRGELRLDQPVRVRNEFTSIFDGSTFALEAREDADPELYAKVGSELPLQELVRRMIVRSSNLATNNVIELVGAKRVMALMEHLGAHDIRVLRGVEDDKAYEAGMNNVTTAHDLMLVFRGLAESDTPASRAMIDILAAQEFNEGIPAGLPKGVRVAHKTGSITEIAHDGGIVYTPRGNYVLVVLTRGFRRTDDAVGVIKKISKIVYANR
jgi:beta-lactamase class A